MNTTEHLLTILSEECAEVSQRVSKALRFGLKEIQPGQLFTNAERICEEICDLYAVVEMLEDSGALQGVVDIDRIQAKKARVKEFMKYAETCGVLATVAGEGVEGRDNSRRELNEAKAWIWQLAATLETISQVEPIIQGDIASGPVEQIRQIKTVARKALKPPAR